MKLRHWASLIRDLIEVLPSHARADWQDEASIDPARPTVILLSGFAATNRNLSVIRKRFIKDGFNVLVHPMDWHEISDGVRGLYRMAEKLSAVLIQLRKGKCRGNARVYIVAHSAGGLVARYYVQMLGGSHYCDGLVTLGTPHSGTWMAVLGFFCHLILKARCLFQMLPVSPFMQQINHAPLPAGFRFLAISSTDDFLCYRKSAQIPLAIMKSEEIKTLELSGLAHGDFLLSKKSFRPAISFLKQDGFTLSEEPSPTEQSELL